MMILLLFLQSSEFLPEEVPKFRISPGKVPFFSLKTSGFLPGKFRISPPQNDFQYS